MEHPPTVQTPHAHAAAPRHTREVRSLFWQNVVQQLLVSFPIRAAQTPEIADGRLGVMTHGGERIAIGNVVPLFSMSVPADPAQRMLSAAVQCTVFEIHTPEGEVVTLPLEEIRGVHSLSEELIEQLKAMSEGRAKKNDESEPFGFAAFTSLARDEQATAESESEPE